MVLWYQAAIWWLMCVAVHICSALIGRRNSEMGNTISIASNAAPRSLGSLFDFHRDLDVVLKLVEDQDRAPLQNRVERGQRKSGDENRSP